MMMVMLERRSAFRVSPGNHPAKLVMSAVTRANVIMNALLLASVSMFMGLRRASYYLIIDYR